MGRTPRGDIRVGTAGWSYGHWRGLLYPKGLPQNRWLEHYARFFDTVEVNTTFYHLPAGDVVAGWRGRVPDDFLLAVKMSRVVTHERRLRGCAGPLSAFLERVGILGDRLGPVLVQLPPSLERDLDRLGDFLKLLPDGLTVAIEFRNESWYADDTFELLGEHGVCFCAHDMPGRPSPRRAVGPAVYFRFHGPGRRYRGCYTDGQLRESAEWLAKQWPEERSVYAYFNNDLEGHAVANAQTLRGMLGELTGCALPERDVYRPPPHQGDLFGGG